MSKIRLGTDEIKYIMLFEKLTGAKVKDCVQEENTTGFLVQRGDMGLAIGKGGANIEKIRNALGRDVWVVEFSDNVNDFIKNLFQPVNIRQIHVQNTSQDKTVVIEVNRQDRRKVIGPNGSRIKIAKKLAQRHYMIDNISVNVSVS